MNLEDLEKKMVSYKDLLTIHTTENGEKFVEAKKIPSSTKIILRKRAYEKLIKANELIKKSRPNCSLFITYGYRSLERQTERFLEILRRVSCRFYSSANELYEEAHRYVAVPTVAGHPTGGAVDVVIVDLSEKKLDFGSKQYDYSTKNCYVFSPNISKKARNNRMFLRKIIMKVGFAPFDGEWWHFSYGDREWAFYYKKKFAIYKQFPTIFPS